MCIRDRSEDRSTFELALSSQGEESAEAAAAGRAAEVRGELAALRNSITAASSEIASIDGRSAALDSKVDELRSKQEAERTKLDAAVEREQALVATADSAATEHLAAQEAFAALQSERSEADAVSRSAQARFVALGEALNSARAAAGADELQDVDGLVGTLLDVVAIEPGWENAVEAALGEALSAVVVESADSGRAALEAFANGRGSGAVIALDASASTDPASPDSVVNRVTAQRTDAAGVLSGLLGNIDAIDGDWRTALDLSLIHISEPTRPY